MWSFKENITLKDGVASIGKYDLPIVIKQNIDLNDIKLLGFSETTKIENRNSTATVHFFESDEKFDEVWKYPSQYLERLSQYRQVLSPDFSQYIDMPVAVQIHNVYKNRWCANYWQRNGLVVIPTITWSDENSFEYSFNSIEKNSCIAISTVGCKKNEQSFMDGFHEMLKKIEPMAVICHSAYPLP